MTLISDFGGNNIRIEKNNIRIEKRYRENLHLKLTHPDTRHCLSMSHGRTSTLVIVCIRYINDVLTRANFK